MATPSDAEITKQINVRLEALKLIKDYSAALIIVQSGLIAVTGSLLKPSLSVPLHWLVGVLFVTLVFSIYIGAVAVAGTIPSIAQRLADDPTCDIYEQTGGIPNSLVHPVVRRFLRDHHVVHVGLAQTGAHSTNWPSVLRT